MADDIKNECLQHLKSLKNEQEQWRTHWQEMAEYMLPYKEKYLNGVADPTKDGKKKGRKILNGVAGKAHTTLASGMQGGLTNPSRPWFLLSIQDEQLLEEEGVREWLHTVRQLMMSVFAKSNFYGSVHSIYRDLGLFGTAAMLIEEDTDTVIRLRPFTTGEYYLSLNDKYIPDTIYREFKMTAKQLLAKFGEENLSDAVKTSIKNNNIEDLYTVVHCIKPNAKINDRDENEYKSIYFELSSEDGKLLRESGYRTKPFVAPRWDVNGTDTYGISPGMLALADVMMLQKMEEKKLKALDKMVDPPMNAPTSMKRTGATIISGGVNYLDPAQGGQTFTPVYNVKPDLQNMAFEIDRVETRIKNYFFNNLFLAILDQNKTMTATEVAQRTQEKLLILGNVVDRTGTEMLNIVIERTYNIMLSMGLIPEPPEVIQGTEFNIEYISLLAQAQKVTGLSAIEQTAAFVGNLAGADPNVLDKFDFDQAVDEYAKTVGVPPTLIRSDTEVKKIRAAKAEAAQQAQQQQMMAAAPQGAKQLSDSKLGENNALEVLTGRA